MLNPLQSIRMGRHGKIMEEKNRILTIIRRTFLTVAWVLLVIFGLSASDEVLADDFDPLLGRWQRADGGYVIEVRKILSDGRMDAGYFNPRPINVARAQASVFGDKIKIEVELRDKGYPGSTYTLIYAADKDALFGYYYHAPSRQNIDVVFVRISR
jgi:hypothetical protein